MGLLLPVCTCATLTDERTDTRGCLRVEGIPGVTTAAHGRAVSGTGGTGFGIAVRARAFVRCRDKHVFQALMCAYVCHIRQFWRLCRVGLVCNVGVIPNTNQCMSALNPFRKHHPDQ